MVLLMVVVPFIILVGGCYLYAVVVLRPLFARMKEIEKMPFEKGKPQFVLPDVFSLMFLSQVPLAIVSLTSARINDIPPLPRMIVVGGLMFAGSLVWFIGLRAVNHLRIDSRLKRVVGSAFVCPAAIFGGLWMLGSFVIFTECLRTQNWFFLLFIAAHLLLAIVTFYSAKWMVAATNVQ